MLHVSRQRNVVSPAGSGINSDYALVARWQFMVRYGLLLLIGSSLVPATAVSQESGTEVFRPEPGTFPSLEKAHSYRGELVFVDHANRRGSIRIDGAGRFRFAGPSPFAMLPYGMIRYRGAPADLRDIPLGTVLHVKAFLPPDPRVSSVPVLPVNNRLKKLGYAGTGVAPAENHVLLLEDDLSHGLRHRLIWKLNEIDITKHSGTITSTRRPENGTDSAAETTTFSFDAATRIWRGRELLEVADLIHEGTWPASGKNDIDGQEVHLGLAWKPTPGGVFTRFHIVDIWLDRTALDRATRRQNERHKDFIRSRWMPARVDAVEYGKFGSAKVTATLFGGMDESLYADFRTGSGAMLAASENTLKHWASGTAGTAQMAGKGTLTEVRRSKENIPMGSSGIQVSLKTDLVTEGFRPGRIVRIRPNIWPLVEVPREEYLHDARTTHKDRFPPPDIFPVFER